MLCVRRVRLFDFIPNLKYLFKVSVTVCFFVLCKRHWFNRVPGAHRGDSLHLPFTLTRTLAMPSYF